MKGRVVVLGHLGARELAALMVDGRLDDLIVDPAGDTAVPGTVFRGIVERPMKGQGGVIVRLPAGHGFLRQSRGLRPGEPILVQVTGFAEPGKAVPVTERLIFKGRHAIVTPGAPGVNVSRSIRDDEIRMRLLEIAEDAMQGADHGLIMRSSAAGAGDADVTGDIAAMRSLADDILAEVGKGGPETLLDGPGAHTLAWREWSVPAPDEIAEGAAAMAEHGVADALGALHTAQAGLPGGGSLWIEPTRALVAVDVNTGGDLSPAAALKANLAAARELPRQLRLRGLGGQVVLDLAPLLKKDRRQFETALKSAFRADPVETALVGWTPLGHFELQRKRERAPVELRET